MRSIIASVVVCSTVSLACPALAQEATAVPVVAQPAPPPLPVAQPVGASAVGRMTVPANTPITVRMNSELHTQRNREGETFYATVASDVVHNGYVVIPAGSRAIGRITWITQRGMFGKSGKMDISIDAVELGSMRIPTVGTFRQEGEGNTVATVGALVVVPVAGFFVNGRSGIIPAGRELQIHTNSNFDIAIAQPTPVTPPVASPVVAPPVAAPALPSATPMPDQM